LVLLVVIQLETLQQFLPVLRLDGYYVVSDLVGVPNLFAYMRPVLVTLTPGTSDDERRVARRCSLRRPPTSTTPSPIT
jgi:putative peptide zinc metalloprotease protein